MKRLRIIFIMALSAIFICCANTAKKTDAGAENDNTPADVKSFGLVGNVKEVTVTVLDLSSEKQESWVDSTQYMKFDDNGRVLKDRFDLPYKYDDKGNFVYGLSEKSVMRRDEQGRIVYYENRMDEEDDLGFDLKIEYDDKGRMAKTQIVGWESTVDEWYTYTDDHVYPDQQKLESEDEGDHYSTVITYTYKKFDDKGNWTEREVKTVSKHTIDDEDQGTEESTQIQQRKILYY